MKENKILAWVNNHKKGLAISVGCAVGGLIAIAITRGSSSVRDLPIPELEIGKITELWKEVKNGEEIICTIADDLTVADLGRFGEELAKKVDGITFESTVSAIMGFARK